MKKKANRRKHHALRVLVLAILISASSILLARAFYSTRQDAGIPGHNRQPTLSVASCRGAIFDRNHRELAVNVTRYSIYAYPLDIDDPDQTVAALSNILSIDKNYLLKVLKCQRAFVWVARRVAPEQAKMIKDLKLKGIHFTKENYRLYPQNSLAAQVIGLADSDGRGVEGVEWAYDHLLHLSSPPPPNKGGESSLLTANRKSMEAGSNSGHDIILTLDGNIQALAEKELDSMSTKGPLEAGTVIVMDVKGGAILAMANYPFYNPNLFWETGDALRRNRAIADTYELGELIQFFRGAASLEEQVTKEEKALPTAQVKSNKRAAATGDPSPQFWYDFLCRLGFGKRSGIALPDESSGTLPPYDRYKNDAAALSGGEGITATPVQIITAFGAILNQGLLIPPRVVTEATEGQGIPTRERGMRQVCTPEVSEKIRSGLICNRANKKKACDDLILLTASKQTHLPNDPSPDDPSIDKSARVGYIKYFLGGLPANDPRVAVLMVLQETAGEGEAGAKVEYSMKKMAYAALRTLSDPRTRVFIAPRKEKKPWTYGEKSRGPAGSEPTRTAMEKEMIMPDLRGKCMREALHILQGYDVSLVMTGSGVAAFQSPMPGTKLRKASRCIIKFKPSL